MFILVRRFLPASAFLLTLGLCIAGGSVFSTQASAAGEERPTILNTMAADRTEESVKLEATIDPHNSETKYEIWLECASAADEAYCVPVAPQAQGGVLAADTGEQTVSVTMTGLQPGHHYSYRVAASNAAGTSEVHWKFSTQQLGACTGGVCPYISEVSFADYEADRKYAEEAPKREAERQAKAAAEQAEREAQSQTASQPSALENQTSPEVSSVELAATAIIVRNRRVALVKLECLGPQSCRGRLTLTAKAPVKSNGRHEHAHAATIGVGSFSIPGERAKTVEIDVDAAGRALLAAHDRRLRARLTVQELTPGHEDTWGTSVHLLRHRTHTTR